MDIAEFVHMYLDRNPQLRPYIAPLRTFGEAVLLGRQRNSFRKLHDFLSNVESGTVVVRVDGFNGKFEFDIRSHVLHRILVEKEYEPRLSEIVHQHLNPNRDVIDVGANVGLFTVLVARKLNKGRIALAIEPTPNALAILRSNIRRNSCEASVEIFEGVASDRTGEVDIYSVQGKEEYSSIGGVVHQSVSKDEEKVKFSVPSARLDDLVARRNLDPGLVKVDTEGAEYLVFSGADTILSKHRPLIVSELQDNLLSSLGHSAQLVVNLLHKHEYLVHDIRDMSTSLRFPFNGDIVAIPQ